MCRFPIGVNIHTCSLKDADEVSCRVRNWKHKSPFISEFTPSEKNPQKWVPRSCKRLSEYLIIKYYTKNVIL